MAEPVPRIVFEPVALSPEDPSGSVFWCCRGYHFHWDGNYLWLTVRCTCTCLVQVQNLHHAIQWSLGFTAGRFLPLLGTDEIIQIH